MTRAEHNRKYKEEHREAIKAQKKLYNALHAEERNAKAREAYAMKKEEARAEMEKMTRAKVTRHAKPKVKPIKVIDQPADTVTLKEIARELGLTMFLLRTIAKEPAFNMPRVTMLRVDGVDLYNVYEIREWMQVYKEALINRTILGTSKRKSGGITLTKEVMMLVNWVVNCAHIERHTMRLQQETASKRLCASYGVKSLLEIKL